MTCHPVRVDNLSQMVDLTKLETAGVFGKPCTGRQRAWTWALARSVTLGPIHCAPSEVSRSFVDARMAADPQLVAITHCSLSMIWSTILP